jgi:hypothetical protein
MALSPGYHLLVVPADPLVSPACHPAQCLLHWFQRHVGGAGQCLPKIVEAVSLVARSLVARRCITSLGLCLVVTMLNCPLSQVARVFVSRVCILKSGCAPSTYKAMKLVDDGQAIVQRFVLGESHKPKSRYKKAYTSNQFNVHGRIGRMISLKTLTWHHRIPSLVNFVVLVGIACKSLVIGKSCFDGLEGQIRNCWAW